MKFEPKDIIEITKILEPHFLVLIEQARIELQRQLNPLILSSKEAAYLLDLDTESTLTKRICNGKYIEGYHFIKKNGKIKWHRDHLLLEEFQKSKGITS
jgi:hypothetical protein